MAYIKLLLTLFFLAFNANLLAAFPASGIIYNSTIEANKRIALGVLPQGHLNTYNGNIVTPDNSGATGLAYKFTDGLWRDSTSPGCLCEGWGVSAINSAPAGSVFGYANVSVGGVYNLEVKSFVVDTTSIISTVWIKNHLGNPILEVTHRYGPSANNPNTLFQALVTVTNISGNSLTDVRYNRTMDWDIYYPVFQEYVSHYGVRASVTSARRPRVLYAGDNGFMLPNPLSPSYSHYMNSSTFNTDFVMNGPNDHGSAFTFQLGDLVCGESINFMIYYGASSSRSTLVNALTNEGASIYSIGESRNQANPWKPSVSPPYPSFGFGFKGLSGTAMAPSIPIKTAALPAQTKTSESIVQTYTPPVLSSSVSGTSKTDFIYQAIFNYKKDKQWFGDILRYNLVGGEVDPASKISASQNLINKLSTSSNIDKDYVSGGRSIWTAGNEPTCSSGSLDATINNFNTSRVDTLTKLMFNCPPSPTSLYASTIDIINFIRGRDVHMEGLTARDQTMVKSSILGDTFHSDMVIVGPPGSITSSSASTAKTEAYYLNSQGYDKFKSDNAKRRKQIYVGANDGMLHAFDENLNERWAFIPPPVVAKLRDMMGTKGSFVGGGKSNSVYSVDGPITVKDIWRETTTNPSGQWVTILMGGLGYGGKAYYAIDITNPDNPRHLFSFENDTTNSVINYWNEGGIKYSYPYASVPVGFDFRKLGSSWSRPHIMRIPWTDPVYSSSKEGWVAVFGGGYVGGTGGGFGTSVFVVGLEPTRNDVPIRTTGGSILRNITIPADTTLATTDLNYIPNGVTAHMSVITSNTSSLAKSSFYGGIAYFTDLQGQLWKLNLSKKSLSEPNTNLFSLSRAFRTEGTLANDRLAFNQLASTEVSNKIFHYFGTGDQTRIQRKTAGIRNRIYGIKDIDFPDITLAKSGTDLSVTTNPASFNDMGTAKASSNCSDKNWFTDTNSVSKLGGSLDVSYEKVIGRGVFYNNNLGMNIYRPSILSVDASTWPAGEIDACPAYGKWSFVEFSSASTCEAKTTLGGIGLPTTPISDGKGNYYIGVSNIPPDKAATSAVTPGTNIAKITSKAASTTGQKIKIKSWREMRNN